MRRSVASVSVSAVVLTCAVLFLSPSVIFANGIALSQATLDWSGFTVVASDGLTLSNAPDSLQGYACSYETAFFNGANFSDAMCGNSDNWYVSSRDVNFGTADGSIIASSSAAQGMLRSSSQSSATSPNVALYWTAAWSRTSRFWMVDGGSGTLTVTIPYTISATCNTEKGTTTIASASVSVESISQIKLTGKGDSISCNTDGGDRSGTFTLSGSIYTGPPGSGGSLFGLEIIAYAVTAAQVGNPKYVAAEPVSAALLAVGMLMLGGLCKRSTGRSVRHAPKKPI